MEAIFVLKGWWRTS
ncbi:trp operon leader peptide [Escherichia coli]|nr:trp operon leader peptide [Escherichia coli]